MPSAATNDGASRGSENKAVPVTGFSCSRLQKILTHDFTHRTHMLIFEHYYPPVFSDWWMDDWISKVRR